MRKIGKLRLSGIFVLIVTFGNAQSFVETALLFSRTQPGGSARIQSLGGSQTALGGDFSSALSNPAGLGMYNRSEFTFSPAYNIARSSADYLNQNTTATKPTLHIPAFSMTFHNDYGKLIGFLNGTFGISFSRINDFNRTTRYEGTNANNSIIDYFLEDAQGAPNSQFNGALQNTPTHLAYENYLIGDSTVIDANANPNAYFTDVLGIPFQVEEIETKGAQNQWSFSYGANFNDQLFLGIGVGATTMRYRSQKTYRENFQGEPLLDLMLEESLEIKGAGINASIGAIFRPSNFVQLALSATTPTRYELSDTYSAFMRTNWDNFQYDPSTLLTQVEYSSEIVTSDYNLRTPGKLNVGVTFFLEKSGFITADVEHINYSNAKYNSLVQGVSFDVDNEDIKTLYQSVFNFRTGAEFRHNKFRFRAGYAYLPGPFQSPQNNVSAKIQRFTGGIGYRQSNFFVDLAIINSFSEGSYRPYVVNTNNSPLVTFTTNATNIMFTVGLPF